MTEQELCDLAHQRFKIILLDWSRTRPGPCPSYSVVWDQITQELARGQIKLEYETTNPTISTASTL